MKLTSDQTQSPAHILAAMIYFSDFEVDHKMKMLLGLSKHSKVEGDYVVFELHKGGTVSLKSDGSNACAF